MKSHVFGLALLSVIAVTLPPVSAQAQNGTLTRSFVSSSGLDTNSCMITAPCQTFAVAYTKIGANGIIAALDPGKYGPIAITGPVTINGNGWAAITGPANNNGITINAVSGNVILTGLEVDGAGAADNGIVFSSGTNLTIENCIVSNFVDSAIVIQPSSGVLYFAITNTKVGNNQGYGVSYQPDTNSATVYGVIDNLVATSNISGGIYIFPTITSGGTNIAISDSIVSNNNNINICTQCGTGIYIYRASGTATLWVSIDNVKASGNGVGIEADGTAQVVLGRSVVTNNSNGVNNGTSPNTFYSFGDNRIELNAFNLGAGALGSYSPQ
jgi:hypothetical protein